MSQEDYPVDFVLESIEAAMGSLKQPKVLLFDIGGVCVVSPFQAILDYEITHSIPPGWVNFCISRSKPNGYWQRLERGELPMDAAWFAGFNSDLHKPALWKEFYSLALSRDATLPTTLPPLPNVDGTTLFWTMMNSSRTPDPWMYPALQALQASRRYILAALSNTMIFPPSHPYTIERQHDPPRNVFDVYISSAHVGLRKPEAEIYALALREVDKFAREHADLQHPEWRDGVSADEVLFLDDIGENLKAGKAAGFRTLKVNLGRAFEAVDELEKVTGLSLAGSHPRVPVLPVAKGKGKGKGSGARL